jgi:aryl-alcohol dehydrogenase-like predicted oxidoreductase
MLDYLQKFGELSEKSDINRVALAYRWTRYHSELGADDTIIFSASSVKQLEETLKVLQEGPLDAWIVERLNEMWTGIKEVAPVDNYQIMLA